MDEYFITAWVESFNRMMWTAYRGGFTADHIVARVYLDMDRRWFYALDDNDTHNVFGFGNEYQAQSAAVDALRAMWHANADSGAKG
jgi:hypothetical protein